MVGEEPPGGFPVEGIWFEDSGEYVIEWPTLDGVDRGSTDNDYLDPFHNMQHQLFDAFDVGDWIREGLGQTQEEDHDADLDFDEVSTRLDHLEELYMQASRLVYSGINVSIVSTTIVLMNMAMVHGVSNSFMNELLEYLGSVLLPRMHYEAKRLIQRLGLNYKIIDACWNRCILYRKDKEFLSSCPEPGCGLSRYIEGSNSILAKVIRWFPLIPRLLRMWRSTTISKLLKYHTDNPNRDRTVMKSVADSPV
jgi:hypothetical protein